MKVLLILVTILLVLYLLLVAPRMMNRADRTPFMKQKFYAHRGLFHNEGEAPENSLAAFRKAVDAGYGMEFDVQLSKDDKLVVFHDATLKRMCGVEGNVWDYTLEELQKFHLAGSKETIPTFEEVLKLVDGKVPLIIEYKMDRPLTKVCALGNEVLKGYKGDYCIESFHPFALMWYKKHRQDVMRGQLSGNLSKETKNPKLKKVYTLVTYLLTNVLTRPDFIAYDHRYVNNISRRVCRALGALSVTYTIKSVERYEEVKDDFELFIFDSCILK
ncbi:MAG: glycerophosphodiester phosphodiesterase [Lachnospiraceae bacterium]|nr:glycerophosphodiester phosphodiesterase [Lachnospiraceae bacterium]